MGRLPPLPSDGVGALFPSLFLHPLPPPRALSHETPTAGAPTTHHPPTVDLGARVRRPPVRIYMGASAQYAVVYAPPPPGRSRTVTLPSAAMMHGRFLPPALFSQHAWVTRPDGPRRSRLRPPTLPHPLAGLPVPHPFADGSRHTGSSAPEAAGWTHREVNCTASTYRGGGRRPATRSRRLADRRSAPYVWSYFCRADVLSRPRCFTNRGGTCGSGGGEECQKRPKTPCTGPSHPPFCPFSTTVSSPMGVLPVRSLRRHGHLYLPPPHSPLCTRDDAGTAGQQRGRPPAAPLPPPPPPVRASNADGVSLGRPADRRALSSAAAPPAVLSPPHTRHGSYVSRADSVGSGRAPAAAAVSLTPAGPAASAGGSASE